MFGQKNILDTMTPKPRNEYNPSAKSVKEYAYAEDCNFSCRPAMEDGKTTIFT